MKKLRVLSLVLCCILVLFSFSGCSLSSLGIGLSAYEIAVKNGFTGTEQEWLDSLKGDSVQWENLVKDLEKKIEGMVSDLESNSLDMQYATNLAMRSSVKVLAGTSVGSGTIINYDENTKKAHILTCFHVIADTSQSTKVSSNIRIYFYGAESTSTNFVAKYLGGEPYSDIAFLEVTLSEEVWNKFSLKVAEINTEKVANGKECVAIGNSKNKGLNAVKTNVSLESQVISFTNVNGTAGNTNVRVMRLNALLAHGNSGGGLFDVNGNLIGVVNAKSTDDEEQNFSYAIPANVAYGIYVNILNQVEKQGKIGVEAVKCQIGLNFKINDVSAEYDQAKMDYYSVQEVGVKSSSNSKIKENDVILEATLKRSDTEIASIKVISIYDLGELMWQARVGDSLTLKYKRDYTISYETLAITSTINNLYAVREELAYA